MILKTESAESRTYSAGDIDVLVRNRIRGFITHPLVSLVSSSGENDCELQTIKARPDVTLVPAGTMYNCGSLVPASGPKLVDPSIYSVILVANGGTLKEVSRGRLPVLTTLTLKQRGRSQNAYLAGDFEIKVTRAAFVGTPQLPTVTIEKISNRDWKATCRHSKSVVN